MGAEVGTGGERGAEAERVLMPVFVVFPSFFVITVVDKGKWEDDFLKSTSVFSVGGLTLDDCIEKGTEGTDDEGECKNERKNC
jgi:hypothetical protein